MKRFPPTLLIMLAALSCIFAQAKPQDATPSQDQKSVVLSARQIAQLEQAKQLTTRVLQLYQAENFKEALPLAERALELREEVLGPEHALVANSLSNLAALYMKKPARLTSFPPVGGKAVVETSDDKDKAQALFERALKIYEHEARPEVARVLIVLNSLAQLYDFRLLSTRGTALATGFLRSSIGSAFTPARNDLAIAVKQRDEAVAFHERALALKERLLGQNHAEVLATLIKVAEIYRTDSFGGSAKAEPFYRRATGIVESQPSPLPLDSTYALGRYACFMREKKREDEALALEARAYGFSTSGAGALRLLSGDELKAQAIELPAPTPSMSFSSKTSVLISMPHPQLETTAHLIVDESGKVIHACSLNGEPLQWINTEEAAYKARFKPLLVDGHAVKFAGRITYKPVSK